MAGEEVRERVEGLRVSIFHPKCPFTSWQASKPVTTGHLPSRPAHGATGAVVQDLGRVHAHLAQSAVPEAFRPSARLRPPFSRMRPMSSSTRRGSSWRPLRCAPPRVTRTCRHGRGGRIRRTFGPKAPRAKTGGGRVHLGSRLRWATNDSGASVWSVCPGVFLYSSFVSREAAPQLQVRLNGFQRDVVTLL